MALTREEMDTGSGQHFFGFFLDASLRSYSQIFFSRSRFFGALLLLATAVVPRIALSGLIAVAMAFLITRLLHFSDDLTRNGLLGYNSLLIGLGAGALLGYTVDAVVLGCVGVIAAVLMTVALHAALGNTFKLPPLTLPFLFVFYLMLGSARLLDVPLEPLPAVPGGFEVSLPRPVSIYLQSLGALFFAPRVEAGILILIGLLVHSRIAVFLSLIGFGVAYLIESRLVLLMDGWLPMVLCYNAMLTTIALGGVWFVPSPASMLLAAGGALLCGIAAIGLAPLMAVPGLPILILPFNLTVLLMLYGMGQRLIGHRPKAVDFPIGAPEENLRYFQARSKRFGTHYLLRFRAPFLGGWTCTQETDGEYTHRHHWRHAFDFEVRGTDGTFFRGNGTRLEDYRCYRLPILSTADGTVTRVIDDVEDNPIGSPNRKQNWGNLVLIYHAPGLYSLVCHLAQGSINVREGQCVRRGDILGMCGNSGRSYKPHLHFQLQASTTIGAPTVVTELHDVVIERDGGVRFLSTSVPQLGDTVRNPGSSGDGLLLPLTKDEELIFEFQSHTGGRLETIKDGMDREGSRFFRSVERGARIYYDLTEDLFRSYDTIRNRHSVLNVLHAALASVPFEIRPDLRWNDHLQLCQFLPGPARVLMDFASPFMRSTLLEMEYHIERDGSQLTVVGESLRKGGNSLPYVTTRADIEVGRGLQCIEVKAGGRHHIARRTTAGPDAC